MTDTANTENNPEIAVSASDANTPATIERAADKSAPATIERAADKSAPANIGCAADKSAPVIAGCASAPAAAIIARADGSASCPPELLHADNACCFTGHRDLSAFDTEALLRATSEAIRSLYKLGVTRYYAGGALGFDMLASVTVLNLKYLLPELKLTIVLPCENHDRYWNRRDTELLNRIISRADETVCLSGHYTNGCMSARNRYMSDRSAYCVCCLAQSSGGTFYTVNYSRSHGLKVINLADISKFASADTPSSGAKSPYTNNKNDNIV